jgi:sugar lactone lactonase YvrE
MPDGDAPGTDGVRSRAIGVADSLELSEDGKRLYFSEPFSYGNADLDDALDEAIAQAGNGRLWMHDLESGVTRLVAEGFHFINGVLCDPQPGGAREQSVIVSQTSLFRLTRFHLSGPKAGTAEVVIDSLPGTPDGIDRDAAGRIWLSMFVARSKLLTWIHTHAWIKPLVMRLPARLLAAQERRTGVVVVSADGSRPLYSGFHSGPELASISSAIPAPDGIYLANVSLSSENPERKRLQRLAWPVELEPASRGLAERVATASAPGAAAWS